MPPTSGTQYIRVPTTSSSPLERLGCLNNSFDNSWCHSVVNHLYAVDAHGFYRVVVAAFFQAVTNKQYFCFGDVKFCHEFTHAVGFIYTNPCNVYRGGSTDSYLKVGQSLGGIVADGALLCIVWVL